MMTNIAHTNITHFCDIQISHFFVTSSIYSEFSKMFPFMLINVMSNKMSTYYETCGDA